MALENPLFEASYRRVFGEGVSIGEGAQAFFDQFYQRFLTYPGIAELFDTVDLDRQASMMRKSLYQLIACYLFDEPSADLRRLVSIHSRVGIAPEQYDIWLQALLETLSEHDPEFDGRTRLAWCWALSPGMTYMKLATEGNL